MVHLMARLPAVLLAGASIYVLLLSAPAHAHGLPPKVATFILAFIALALVSQTVADFLAIKRLFGHRSKLAAILVNLAAAAVAMPLFLILEWLSGATALALESVSVRSAYWLRALSPWPESFITIGAVAVTKATILGWHFGEPLSRRTVGLLLLSTIAGMCLAAAAAALLASATKG